MNDLLLILGCLAPMFYGYRRSVSHGTVEINHVTTFSFGFLFYWITPLAVRLWASRLHFPLASVWSGFFRAHLIEPYALACIALYLCFAVGDSVGVALFRSEQTSGERRVPTAALLLTTLFACGLMVYSIYTMRADLFRYATPTDLRAQSARGAVTACIVLMAAAAILYAVQRGHTSWRKLATSVYFVPLIAGCCLMIYLGSRLYVASILLMFAVLQTNLRSRFRLKAMIAAVVLAAAFFGAVGTWREGSSVKGAFFNVLLEPMEDSLSLVHHLRYKGISWINAPTQLISDAQNLIPTVLMPDKFKTLKKPHAYRPLGGLHSFVSFDMNFGVIGTGMFWFLLPVAFRWIKSRSDDVLFATVYVMCSGWLAFTFFRDPFSISLVKAIFEDSILVPLAIVGFGQLLVAACKGGPEPKAEPTVLPAPA